MVVSNTGPLISAFQSHSLDLMVALFETVHTSEACVAELVGHGWDEALAHAASSVVQHRLTVPESAKAVEVAKRISADWLSRDSDPDHHLGEAEVIVLVQRPVFSGSLLLLDELAARAIAMENGLTISGFAGALLLAVSEGLISADILRDKLEQCRRQGTHYSLAFIDQVYQAAKAR